MDKNIKKKFWKYVIPSMFTCLLSGVYCLVDGLFIGRSIGDAGLAGINIAWPIPALILAIGTGIGIGGSVVMSNYIGEKKFHKSNKARGNTILLLIIASLLLTTLLYTLTDPILKLLGASGEVYEMARIYCKIFILGSCFQLFGTGLTPLLRNMGHVMFAMVIMIIGFITNIIFDYIFIVELNLGIGGAAFATLTGQALVVLAAIFIMFNKKNRLPLSSYKFDLSIISKILKIALSPFGLSMSGSIIIMFANWQCIRYGGNVAVAAYAVLSYVISTAQLLVQGVGEGTQPLISYYKGAKRIDVVKYIRKKTVLLAISLAIGIGFTTIGIKSIIPEIFGASSKASLLIIDALPIFAVAFPLFAVSRASSAYFYGIQHTTFASTLVYVDPLILTPVFMVTLPLIFGLNGVWLAIPAAQGAIIFAASIFYKRSDKILINELNNNESIYTEPILDTIISE